MLRVRLLAGKGNLQHGSDDRRGHAVTSDVGDENTKAIFFKREEIVEIAGDRAHWEIASGDLQTGDAGHFARENRGLNLLRDFQLFVDGQQAMFVGESAVSRYVAQAAD